MDIQRENGAREMGKREHALQLFCRHLLLFSSSAFGIARMREKLLHCSDSGRRIVVTRIGCTLKLPNNDKKKKKITKFAHSHKEINQIYQSIPNWIRQAHKSNHSCSTHNSFGLVEDS